MKRILMLALFLIASLPIVSSSYTIQEVLRRTECVKLMAQQKRDYRIAELEQSALTLHNVIEYLELLEVAHKEIIIKQVILESGWLKSELTVKYHNLLGMRHPSTRNTLSLGRALGHAYYRHWTDSIKDYLLWRDYWKSRGLCTENYYAFLNNVGYATAKYYIPALQNIDLDEHIEKYFS